MFQKKDIYKIVNNLISFKYLKSLKNDLDPLTYRRAVMIWHVAHDRKKKNELKQNNVFDQDKARSSQI